MPLRVVRYGGTAPSLFTPGCASLGPCSRGRYFRPVREQEAAEDVEIAQESRVRRKEEFMRQDLESMGLGS